MQILNDGQDRRLEAAFAAVSCYGRRRDGQALFRRGGRWTFRAFVPQELRAIIGKREIWKNLAAGTGGGDGENRFPGRSVGAPPYSSFSRHDRCHRLQRASGARSRAFIGLHPAS
ncbi:DUF6538 domain-containing protein [Xanthobacter autotrophicus]|uniref:DUF6538 domain-containing protein n=1 Tax=Xanthobacter autotrophicus TaxID=280 RepID=UPI00373525E5